MADENIIVNEDGTRTDEAGVNIANSETLSETDRKCPNCGGTMDFDPESGNLFQTYASAVAENAMVDYVRKCISVLPPSGRIASLDAPAPGTDPEGNVTYAEIIPDDFSKNPEQLFIKKETITEVRDALQMITDRERTYLHYRYGFMDDLPHDQTETAAHFHLSLSRAKSTERAALDNVRLELPWWY